MKVLHAVKSLRPRHSPHITRSGVLTIALVPKLGCPLCWPMLAAVSSFLGIRFAILNQALLIINAAALLIVLKLILQRRCGPACTVASAVLAAALSYRFGTSLVSSFCLGLLTAFLVILFQRLAGTHAPAATTFALGSVSHCCRSNHSTS